MAALGAHHMMAEHREWLRMHAHKAANAVQACADSCAMAGDTCRALPATSDVHAAQKCLFPVGPCDGTRAHAA